MCVLLIPNKVAEESSPCDVSLGGSPLLKQGAPTKTVPGLPVAYYDALVAIPFLDFITA